MLESKNIKGSLNLIKDESKVLGLRVGGQEVKPGVYIPRAEAQKEPEITYKSTGSYIVIGLDIDAPFPSFGVLGPILHWIQPGFKADATGKLTPTEPFITNYIGPAPPPGSGPHRYMFLLYDQPAGFDGKKWAPADGKKVGNWPRVRYNLEAFEKEAKLGPVLAMNYFLSN